MKQNVKPIPDGYHTVTPGLVIKDGKRAVEFYKKAFGAKQEMYMEGPDGSLTHAEIRIGDSKIMLNGDHPAHPGHEENCPMAPDELRGSTSAFYVYVESADAVYKQAVAAGAKSLMPMTDMFWGDRNGAVKDPFGYVWTIASRTRILTPKQMEEGAKEFYAKAGTH